MSEAALRLEGVSRRYWQGTEPLDVLRGVSLRVERGELVALVGPSGAGKSTLLHIAGLLEYPDDGEVDIEGTSCGALSDDVRTKLRRDRIGFVYQFHHLLPEFSAIENVMVPRMINGVSRREAQRDAAELISAVGLTDRGTHRPARLSGGEQQRVAIIRALANRPSLLLADEPTGNLDHGTADDVFAMFEKLVRDGDLGVLVATHNLDLAKRMDRILRLDGGDIVDGL
jgi:lipoprotein-releasing system ATP-binding protein